MRKVLEGEYFMMVIESIMRVLSDLQPVLCAPASLLHPPACLKYTFVLQRTTLVPFNAVVVLMVSSEERSLLNYMLVILDIDTWK